MSIKNEVIEKAEKHFSQPFFLNMLMSSQECPKIDDDIDLFHMTIPEIVNIVLDSGMDEKELQSRVILTDLKDSASLLPISEQAKKIVF